MMYAKEIKHIDISFSFVFNPNKTFLHFFLRVLGASLSAKLNIFNVLFVLMMAFLFVTADGFLNIWIEDRKEGIQPTINVQV